MVETPKTSRYHMRQMTDPKPVLYLSRLLPDPVMVRIRERFALLQEPVETPPSPSILRDGLAQADAAIVTLTDRIDEAALERTQKLKIVANYAVGYNNIDLGAAERRGITVTNTPDVLTDATADITWALILATARRIVEGDQLVRSGRWTGWAPTQLLGSAVSGTTLGIVGMGRIGQAVAHRATGFQMKVLYHTRSPIEVQSSQSSWQKSPLPELLRTSDFVTLHVPLTPDTHHMIGSRELQLMRPSAILINTARGPIVDETALVAALGDRIIAGAGLDVYEDEPRLQPGLSEFKQVVILPHVGSGTMATRVEMGMICIKNINAVLEGRPAPNKVNLPK